MGYFFGPQPVLGADGWPLSGATQGSAVHYDRAVALLRTAPDEAAAALRTALDLAPAFVMAHVAMAHLLRPGSPGTGSAMARFLDPRQKSARESSHVRMLARAPQGTPLRAALLRHLDLWPGDGLAHVLMDERESAGGEI